MTAWTLQADHSSDVELARRRARAGVDRITTDDAPASARMLADPTQGIVSTE